MVMVRFRAAIISTGPPIRLRHFPSTNRTLLALATADTLASITPMADFAVKRKAAEEPLGLDGGRRAVHHRGVWSGHNSAPSIDAPGESIRVAGHRNTGHAVDLRESSRVG